MARIGRVLDSTIPIGAYNLGISGGSNNQIIAFGSNGESYYTTFLRSLRADGTLVLGPDVALASGSNITLTLDRGPLPTAATSNTVRIHSTGGSVSAGSNATRVSEISLAGVAATYSPSDHQHDGIGQVVSNSSNTLQRGTFNIKTGNNISFGLTDSDGDGELDTVQIHSTASGGGGGSGASGALVFLEAHTASSSATLDFTTAISSTYDDYFVEIVNILPASNSVDFLMRMGAGSFDSGANYKYTGYYDGIGDAITGLAVSGATSIHLANSVRNDSNNLTVNATLRLYGPGTTTSYKGTSSQTQASAVSAGNLYHWTMGGGWFSTSAADRFQFLFSSGNIASGTIRVYGVSKS